ncbi:MAG: hypothetical protein RLZZ230_728 [Candidatus Parcubacteria bacterium]|jgi:broad-specificity NMP kinase
MKFILLNGTSGVGKTTVAWQIHELLPLSVMVPNFEIRRMISGFKNDRDKSREIMFNLTYGIIEQALVSGVDVIVDSKIHDDMSGKSVADRFINLAKKMNADVYEIILTVDKAQSLERIKNRGFSTDGILTEENIEENVDKFMSAMNEYTLSRGDAVILDTSNLTPEEVLSEVKKIIEI